MNIKNCKLKNNEGSLFYFIKQKHSWIHLMKGKVKHVSSDWLGFLRMGYNSEFLNCVYLPGPRLFFLARFCSNIQENKKQLTDPTNGRSW